MPSPRQPDVLLVVLDTLRRDHLNVYDYPIETAPGLADFAGHATLFTRAVAPAQWTIPAHASLFSGVYPSRHGVTQANSALGGDHPTLAEILSVGGYRTVAFCNNPLVGVLNNGLQRGFDDYYNYASAIPHRPHEDGRRDLSARFTRWFRPYARRIGNHFAQSDDLFRLSLHPLLTPLWSKYINFKGNTTESIGDLIDYLGAHHAGGSDRPLFAFVNLMGAHLPYHPPRDVLARVAPTIARDKAAFAYMRRFNADAAAWASPPESPFSPWERAVLTGFYDAEIAAQDAQLNRLFTHLRTTGALDHTAVFVVADHGEGHGDHDLFGHGFGVHQELVHVPLIAHVPDRTSGDRVTTNVSTRRLFHTILDLAGLTPPIDASDANADVRGLSLLRLLDGDTSAEAHTACSEAVPPSTFLHVLAHRSPALIDTLRLHLTRRAIYAGDHKLMTEGETPVALYNVADDPHELRDRSTDDAETVASLSKLLTDFVDRPPEAYQPPTDARVIAHLRDLGYLE